MTSRPSARLGVTGAVFAYPTESFYALGADATDAAAIQRLFRLKKREPNKPIALIAADLRQVKKFFMMSKTEEQLAKKFWPGPLTIILRPKKRIAAHALGAARIGIRMPAHAGARMLARYFRAPMTATSANISGQPPTKSKSKVIREFPGILIMPGRCGKSTQPSTIISVTSKHISVLRPGAVHETSLHS